MKVFRGNTYARVLNRHFQFTFGYLVASLDFYLAILREFKSVLDKID